MYFDPNSAQLINNLPNTAHSAKGLGDTAFFWVDLPPLTYYFHHAKEAIHAT